MANSTILNKHEDDTKIFVVFCGLSYILVEVDDISLAPAAAMERLVTSGDEIGFGGLMGVMEVGDDSIQYFISDQIDAINNGVISEPFVGVASTVETLADIGLHEKAVELEAVLTKFAEQQDKDSDQQDPKQTKQ